MGMAADRLRDCLSTLMWSKRGLAKILNRYKRQVRHWASGDYSVPDDVADRLERLAAVHDANPPP
jgi:ribosome-binding protein aMBF1 (putative translation factor)